VARTEHRQHREDRHGQAEVADAVDHEGLLARGGRGGLVLPERDQQVRGEADALPADEQHRVVVREDEREHGRDEQVQVGEEPATAGVVRHVADGVDVDQAADARDQQGEQDRQRVDQQADVDLPGARLDPCVQGHVHRTLCLGPTQQVDEQDRSDHERHDRGQRGHVVGERVRHLAEHQEQGRGQQRDRDQEPGNSEQTGGGHRRQTFEQSHRFP